MDVFSVIKRDAYVTSYRNLRTTGLLAYFVSQVLVRKSTFNWPNHGYAGAVGTDVLMVVIC